MQFITDALPVGAKVHKIILPALRIIVALFALGYILWRLSLFPLDPWKNVLVTFQWPHFILLAAAGLMSALNWGLEARKWQILASKLEPLNYRAALKGVLWGVSLGMITPKRSGEFAGRILVLAAKNRLRGLLINMAGSVSQLLVTLVMGCLGLFFLQGLRHALLAQQIRMPGDSRLIMFGLVVLCVLVLLFLLVFTYSFVLRYKKSRMLVRMRKILRVFALLRVRDYGQLLLLSLGRYLVFVTQFYILLWCFGIPLGFFTAVGLIAVVYLLMLVVPVSALSELAVRGSVVLFVFGLYLSDRGFPFFEVGVLYASSLLWVINLAFPALAGSFWVLKDGPNRRNQISSS